MDDEEKYLQDDGRRYTVAQQLVELRADLHDPRWRLFLDNHVTDFIAVCLPVRFCDCYGTIESAMIKGIYEVRQNRRRD